MFNLTESPIDAAALRQTLLDNEQCGAFTCFEGWVRRQNDGNRVEYLIYSTYPELALTQGQEVIAKAKAQFDIENNETIDELIQRADIEMYKNKEAYKNNCTQPELT